MNQSTDEGCTSKGLKYSENQACIHSSGFSMFIGQLTRQFGLLCSSYPISSRTRCWWPSLSHVRRGDWTEADIRCLIWWWWGGGELFPFLFVFNRGVWVSGTHRSFLAWKKDAEPDFPGPCLLHVHYMFMFTTCIIYYMDCRSSINDSKKKVVKTGIRPII